MYGHVQFGSGGGEATRAINVFVYVVHYHSSLSNVHARGFRGERGYALAGRAPKSA